MCIMMQEFFSHYPEQQMGLSSSDEPVSSLHNYIDPTLLFITLNTYTHLALDTSPCKDDEAHRHRVGKFRNACEWLLHF